MKTNLSSIPKYTLDLSTITTPNAAMTIFRKNNIVAYVYEIIHAGITLKFGSSMGASRRCLLGERLYRQIGRSPVEGWKNPLTGPNSKDFIDVCNKYVLLTGQTVNKNNIIVNIFDMTKYDFECDWNPKLEVERCEAELIDLYRQFHGHMPMGNIDPELHALRLNIDVSSATLQTFFDYTPTRIVIPN